MTGILVRNDFIVSTQGGFPATEGRFMFPIFFPKSAEVLPFKDTLEKVEGPRYVAQGYAYVLWRASGPLEEVADQVFQRWRADAGVVLDWVGGQPWCSSVQALETEKPKDEPRRAILKEWEL